MPGRVPRVWSIRRPGGIFRYRTQRRHYHGRAGDERLRQWQEERRHGYEESEKNDRRSGEWSVQNIHRPSAP